MFIKDSPTTNTPQQLVMDSIDQSFSDGSNDFHYEDELERFKKQYTNQMSYYTAPQDLTYPNDQLDSLHFQRISREHPSSVKYQRYPHNSVMRTEREPSSRTPIENIPSDFQDPPDERRKNRINSENVFKNMGRNQLLLSKPKSPPKRIIDDPGYQKERRPMAIPPSHRFYPEDRYAPRYDSRYGYRGDPRDYYPRERHHLDHSPPKYRDVDYGRQERRPYRGYPRERDYPDYDYLSYDDYYYDDREYYHRERGPPYPKRGERDHNKNKNREISEEREPVKKTTQSPLPKSSTKIGEESTGYKLSKKRDEDETQSEKKKEVFSPKSESKEYKFPESIKSQTKKSLKKPSQVNIPDQKSPASSPHRDKNLESESDLEDPLKKIPIIKKIPFITAKQEIRQVDILKIDRKSLNPQKLDEPPQIQKSLKKEEKNKTPIIKSTTLIASYFTYTVKPKSDR